MKKAKNSPGKKKKEAKKKGKKPVLQNHKPEEDFGGLPDIDLKRNLGCG